MNNPSSSLPPFLGAIGVEGYSQNLQVMQQIHPSTAPKSQISSQKKRRNQPGHPSPDSEVIALSPKTLTATNRFKCEVCNKGFQREQNLQLHRRGHNLPWKLIKKKPTKEIIRRKVYVCPEVSCVHHEPSRALGDLTGIKKHYYRKHGEKKWKCDKCCKKYAVQSDWKAHSKICGTKEYRCCCGTLFSRRDSFITHRTLCSTMSQDSSRNPHNMSLSGFSQISTNFSPISHFNTLQEYPNSTALNNRRNPNAIFTQNPSQILLIHQDHGGFFINSPLNKHESIQNNLNIMNDGFFSGDYKNFSFLNHKQSDSPQVHQDRHISNFINNNYGEHHNHQVQDPGARNTNADPSTTMFKGLDSCFRLNIGNNGFGGHMGDLSNNLQGLMNTFGDGGGFNVEDTFEGKTLQELRAVTTSSSKLTLDFSLGSEMKFSTEQFDRG